MKQNKEEKDSINDSDEHRMQEESSEGGDPINRRTRRRWQEQKRDGQMWIQPQEVAEELTLIGEQRRQTQMARWESPPPGPLRGR